MPRYDKYNPKTGGFRAPLAANFGYTSGLPNFSHTDLGAMKVVSINASGLVVIGYSGTTTRPRGVLILTEPKAAGDVVDVMTDGEIVEFVLANGSAAAAGTDYTTAVDGTYGTTAVGANAAYIGHTVEAGRLIVRFARSSAALVVGT
jgi:hypothetical protein